MTGTYSSVAQAEVRISNARAHQYGFVTHTVESEYQHGETEIRVLLPDKIETGKRYPVLYLLPVEAGDGLKWGDAQREAKQIDLTNKYGVICVYPTFSHLPWYVDHPSDPQIRQETYFLKVVLPFIERNYPARGERSGRYLLGFSKSGWGAYSLLLRHPDIFAKSAAWDAPLMLQQGRYGLETIAGTQSNMEKYRITDLLKLQANEVSSSKRFVLLGYGNFREPTQQAHELMNSLKIPHEYADGPQRKHDWNTGWVAEAAALLFPAGH